MGPMQMQPMGPAQMGVGPQGMGPMGGQPMMNMMNLPPPMGLMQQHQFNQMQMQQMQVPLAARDERGAP